MSKQPTTAWDLISILIEEATGMTGDEAADRIRVERGASWVRQFKKEYPLAVIFIDQLISGKPQQALDSLALLNPGVRKLPFALFYIQELQRILQNGK